jgi:hypothetical protein
MNYRFVDSPGQHSKNEIAYKPPGEKLPDQHEVPPDIAPFSHQIRDKDRRTICHAYRSVAYAKNKGLHI